MAKFKTFDSVRKALKEGKKLLYIFEADDEVGEVRLKNDKIEVDVMYNGWFDVEAENQCLIDEHNEEFEEDPDSWVGEMKKTYGKRWNSWKDIPDDEFHFVPENFRFLKD